MKQITIVTPVKAGLVADISSRLGDAGINIESVDAFAVQKWDIVQLTVSDYDRALQVLRDGGYNAITEDAVVLIDEAYIAADARSWRGQRNRLLGHLTGLSRQKDVLALYISQEAAKVDVNIVRGVDVLLVKPLGVTQVLFERGPLRAYLQRVREEFRHLKDPRRAVWVLSDEFEGMIREANTPPSFWSEELSCAWRGVELVEQEPRQAPVPPRWALRMVGKDDSWWRTP